MKIKVGDKVKINPESDLLNEDWMDDGFNPKDTVGEVYKTDNRKDEWKVQVRWNETRANSYRESDLIIQ